MASLRPPSSRLNELRQRWDADRTSRVFLQLAEEYRRLGMPKEALPILEEGLTHHPWSVAGQVALGRCRLEVGELEGAAAILETVVERDPTQMVAFRALVDAYLRLGATEQARQRLQHYAQLNPQDPEIAQLRAQLEEIEQEQAVDEAAGNDEGSEIEDGGGNVVGWTEAPSAPTWVESAADSDSSDSSDSSESSDGSEAPSSFEAAAEEAAEDVEAREPGSDLATGTMSEPEPGAVSPSEGDRDGDSEEDAEVGTEVGTGLETVVFDVRSVLSQVEKERAAVEEAPPVATADVAETGEAVETELDAGDRIEGTEAADETIVETGSAEEAEASPEVDAQVDPAGEAPADEAPAGEAPADEAPAVEAGSFEIAISQDAEVDVFTLEHTVRDAVVLDLTSLPKRPLRSPRELEAAPVPRESEPATATLGQLYLRQGHDDEAREIFERVLDEHPEDTSAREGLRLVSGGRGRLHARDLLEGVDRNAGLTMKKIQALRRYLEILRGGSRNDAS